MTQAVLSLGSNLGERLGHLQGAVDSLALRGLDVIVVSPVYETAPVGGPDQGDFLNAVVVVDTDLAPGELLAVCQAIEAEHDRRRDVRWGPRTLDVDIIAIGDLVWDDPDLTLPHPRARERAFVCVPWCAAVPDAELLGSSVRAIVEDLDVADVHMRPDLVLVRPAKATS